MRIEAQETEQAEQEAYAEQAQEAKLDDDFLGILADEEFAMVLQAADVKARSLKVQTDAVKEEVGVESIEQTSMTEDRMPSGNLQV